MSGISLSAMRVIVHDEDYVPEEPDEDAEPATFQAADAVFTETTVEVAEPSEAMIFEEFNLSTEILMVNMFRNDAVILNPENRRAHLPTPTCPTPRL